MAAESNLALLETAARCLGPLLDRLVLVGGCATPLLITDPASGGARATTDVDLVVDAVSRGEYRALEANLRDLGFAAGSEPGDPICRFRHPEVTVDIMPADPAVLGFGSPWYRMAVDEAVAFALPNGLRIRHVPATVFLAAKLDAFHDRGGEDYLASPDLEDILAVIDGRPELLREIAHAAPALRASVAARIGSLLTEARFRDALAGHLAGDRQDPERIAVVWSRLRRLSLAEG